MDDHRTLKISSWIRGFHVYKGWWTPTRGEILPLQPEPENAQDKNAVAVLKESRVIGHIPYYLANTKNRTGIVTHFISKPTNRGLVEVCGKAVNQGGGLGCDDGWKLFDGKCFKLFQEKKSWPDAEKSCKKVEARSVKIESEKLNDFLLKTFMQIPFDEMNRSAWIGLTEKKKEGKFVWLDGTSPTYINWAEELGRGTT
ncbi:hypothetical protein ACROYT_G033496 [Oculina patagonica]